MHFQIKFVLITAFIFGIGKAEPEPRCYSNFDFQEKLLEKMVILTNKVDNLEKAFAGKEKQLDDQMNQIKTEKSKMVSDISRLANDIRHEVRHKAQTQFKSQTQKIAEVEKEMETLMTSAKDQSQTQHKSHKESMLAMERRIDELMVLSEAQITRLSMDVREYTNKSREDLEALVKGFVKPNVAFLARTVSDTSPYPPVRLVFTTTLVNTDNCYSTSTGEFISPVNGTYWFSTPICGVANNYINFRIYVNDVIMSDTSQYDDTGYGCTTANIVAILRTGDKVYVKTGPHTTSYGNVISQGAYKWSMFMGALIN